MAKTHQIQEATKLEFDINGEFVLGGIDYGDALEDLKAALEILRQYASATCKVRLTGPMKEISL